MKKTFLCLLSLVFCFALTGCAGLGELIDVVAELEELAAQADGSSSAPAEDESRTSSPSAPAPFAAPSSLPQTPSSSESPPEAAQSPYVGVYYDTSGQYSPDYTPFITFAADGSFDFCVNLLEGMGNFYGTYEETGGTIDCYISSANFSGFEGENMTYCTFTIVDENTLVYSGDQVGLMVSGTQFTR